MQNTLTVVVVEDEGCHANDICLALSKEKRLNVVVLQPKGALKDFCKEIKEALGEHGLLLLDHTFLGHVPWSGEQIAREFPDTEIVSISHRFCSYAEHNWPHKRFLVDSATARAELASVVRHTRAWQKN